MTVEVEKAIQAAEARCKAAADKDDDMGLAVGIRESSARKILVGFDIDFEELLEASDIHAALAAGMIMLGMPPKETIGGIWFQGFLAGMLHRDMQLAAEKEEAA